MPRNPTLEERMKKMQQKAVALSSSGQDSSGKASHNKAAIPKITAIGHGANAEKILDLAFAAGVKVRKDDDLVEILSKFELDSEIPVEALEAVSEILSHLYKENIRLNPADHKDNLQGHSPQDQESAPQDNEEKEL